MCRCSAGLRLPVSSVRHMQSQQTISAALPACKQGLHLSHSVVGGFSLFLCTCRRSMYCCLCEMQHALPSPSIWLSACLCSACCSLGLARPAAEDVLSCQEHPPGWLKYATGSPAWLPNRSAVGRLCQCKQCCKAWLLERCVVRCRWFVVLAWRGVVGGAFN
jgi:hypothetical protein